MSSLIETEDVTKRFGVSRIDSLADRDGNGALDEDVMVEAMEWASQLVRGLVNQQILESDIPSAQLAKDAAINLTYFNLCMNVPDTMTEEIRKNYYDLPRQILRDIAAGTIDGTTEDEALGDATGGLPERANEGEAGVGFVSGTATLGY